MTRTVRRTVVKVAAGRKGPMTMPAPPPSAALVAAAAAGTNTSKKAAEGRTKLGSYLLAMNKQVGTCVLRTSAVSTLNDMAAYLTERIGAKAAEIAALHSKRTVMPKHVEAAVQIVIRAPPVVCDPHAH